MFILKRMVRIKKVKREIKVLKEISRDIREVRKDENGDIEEEAEEENKEFSDNADFSPAANRTAPVLQTENQNQNLERVAETAPAPRKTEETPASNVLYSADYSRRYDNVKYDTVREPEAVVRPNVRSAGSLTNTRELSLNDMRQMRSAWQDPQQQVAASSWDTNLPEERRYQPKEDSLKEDRQRVEKRRRMG